MYEPYNESTLRNGITGHVQNSQPPLAERVAQRRAEKVPERYLEARDLNARFDALEERLNQLADAVTDLNNRLVEKATS